MNKLLFFLIILLCSIDCNAQSKGFVTIKEETLYNDTLFFMRELTEYGYYRAVFVDTNRNSVKRLQSLNNVPVVKKANEKYREEYRTANFPNGFVRHNFHDLLGKWAPLVMKNGKTYLIASQQPSYSGINDVRDSLICGGDADGYYDCGILSVNEIEPDHFVFKVIDSVQIDDIHIYIINKNSYEAIWRHRGWRLMVPITKSNNYDIVSEISSELTDVYEFLDKIDFKKLLVEKGFKIID